MKKKEIEVPRRGDGEEITLELIREKCIEDAGCWIWQAGYSHGSPAMRVGRHSDKKIMPVRRWIAVNVLGLDVEKKVVTSSCMDKRCVAPDCVAAVTRARLQKMWSDHLRYAQDPVRRMKLQATVIRRLGTDMSLVEAIRNDDRSIRVIAKEIGRSFDFVQKIKSGKHYANPGNPFAGLGAR